MKIIFYFSLFSEVFPKFIIDTKGEESSTSNFEDGTVFKFTPSEKIRENVPSHWQRKSLEDQGIY